MHERVEALARVRHEPSVNRGVTPLVIGAHGAADDAGDTIGGRRLKAERGTWPRPLR